MANEKSITKLINETLSVRLILFKLFQVIREKTRGQFYLYFIIISEVVFIIHVEIRVAESLCKSMILYTNLFYSRHNSENFREGPID